MLGVLGVSGGYGGICGSRVGSRNVLCVGLGDLRGSGWHLGVLGTGMDPAGHLLVLEVPVGSEVICGFQGDLEVSVLPGGF